MPLGVVAEEEEEPPREGVGEGEAEGGGGALERLAKEGLFMGEELGVVERWRS